MAKKQSKRFKTSQTLSNKIQKCPDGHHQQDVYQDRITGVGGEVKGYRYRCKRCRVTLDVTSSENLIGNPFDIVEKRDEVKTAEFLNWVERIAA